MPVWVGLSQATEGYGEAEHKRRCSSCVISAQRRADLRDLPCAYAFLDAAGFIAFPPVGLSGGRVAWPFDGPRQPLPAALSDFPRVSRSDHPLWANRAGSKEMSNTRQATANSRRGWRGREVPVRQVRWDDLRRPRAVRFKPVTTEARVRGEHCAANYLTVEMTLLPSARPRLVS